MKRAIITGATGTAGHALIRQLISRNVEVLVLCHEGSPRNHTIPSHELITLRPCSMNNLSDIQNDTGRDYDVFYHMAWSGTTGTSRNDMYLQAVNIKYSLDAVIAAKRFGCHTFIGTGSQAEYGRVNHKLAPDTPAFPENGYGFAKLCAGLMTRELAHQLGMSHIWVRIVSLYGPHDGPNSMISQAIKTFRTHNRAGFTQGLQLWDYLYSDDAAEALYLLGDKGTDGKVYVLGGGSARPLAEYITELRDIVNPEAAIDFGAVPYSRKQVMYLLADISELEHDTGWRPHTEFADGIRQILALEE